jgi:hypothetical protein
MKFSVSKKCTDLFTEAPWLELAQFYLRSEAEEYIKRKRFVDWRKGWKSEYRIDTL